MTALEDLAHSLRLKGLYHAAIEVEIDRYKLRQLGKVLRESIAKRQKEVHRAVDV